MKVSGRCLDMPQCSSRPAATGSLPPLGSVGVSVCLPLLSWMRIQARQECDSRDVPSGWVAQGHQQGHHFPPPFPPPPPPPRHWEGQDWPAAGLGSQLPHGAGKQRDALKMQAVVSNLPD